MTVGTQQFDNFRWVTHYTDRGGSYCLWENPEEMLPIPEEVLDCAFYVYRSEDDAKEGTLFGGGSGFFVGIPLVVNKECYALYAVTAKHVVNDRLMRHPVLRVNLVRSGFDCIETNRNRWVFHPHDDVAVLPMVNLDEDEYRYSPIMIADFVNANRAQWLALGNDVYMVGRFFDRQGKEENTPSLRFGNIAMLIHPETQQRQDWRGKTYLVEQRSLPGYSGSPVFVYLDPQMPRPNVRILPSQPWSREQHGPWLLGLDSCHIHSYEEVQRKDKSGEMVRVIPKKFVKSHTGMAEVIPAWRLASFLFETEEFIVQRTKADEEISTRKKSETYRSCDSGSEQEPQPFTKSDFEQALKKASRRLPSSRSDEGKK